MNRVFAYFNIECGKVKENSVKEVFRILALEESKHRLRMRDGKSKSLVADLMDE